MSYCSDTKNATIDPSGQYQPSFSHILQWKYSPAADGPVASNRRAHEVFGAYLSNVEEIGRLSRHTSFSIPSEYWHAKTAVIAFGC